MHSGKRAKMGRPKIFAEIVRLNLLAGMRVRMDAVLQVGETRLDMIRKAIEKEVIARERAKNKTKES